MAVVVWVYAGGGEAEVDGFFPFLQRHFINCSFARRTPRRPPGPRKGSSLYSGLTGRSLLDEIRKDILDYWDGTPGAILLMDDTDQRVPNNHAALLRAVATEALKEKAATGAAQPIIVALAVPELETWLLADWDNTFKKEFSQCAAAVQHELATTHKVDFSKPESFATSDDQGVYRKMSEILMDTINLKCTLRLNYSKATDTPRLLMRADPNVIKGKCPYFAEFWNALAKICR
jgi:hypothetical protein